MSFIVVLQTFCPDQHLNNEIMWILTTNFMEGKVYTGNLWGNVTQKTFCEILQFKLAVMIFTAGGLYFIETHCGKCNFWGKYSCQMREFLEWKWNMKALGSVSLLVLNFPAYYNTGTHLVLIFSLYGLFVRPVFIHCKPVLFNWSVIASHHRVVGGGAFQQNTYVKTNMVKSCPCQDC